ncbi:MAG: hypothetical protein MZW92_80320 [Comamonadaceae bacterium]|nr:hypothetical protein [Comamonadaceae bacterium]
MAALLCGVALPALCRRRRSGPVRHPRRFHPLRPDAAGRRPVPPLHAAGGAHGAGHDHDSTSSSSPASSTAPASPASARTWATNG